MEGLHEVQLTILEHSGACGHPESVYVAVRSAGQSSVLVPWRHESFCTSIMTTVTGAETVAVTSAY